MALRAPSGQLVAPPIDTPTQVHEAPRSHALEVTHTPNGAFQEAKAPVLAEGSVANRDRGSALTAAIDSILEKKAEPSSRRSRVIANRRLERFRLIKTNKQLSDNLQKADEQVESLQTKR